MNGKLFLLRPSILLHSRVLSLLRHTGKFCYDKNTTRTGDARVADTLRDTLLLRVARRLLDSRKAHSLATREGIPAPRRSHKVTSVIK